MIIPRKYEWLITLYEMDEASHKIIDEAFELYTLHGKTKAELIAYNSCNIMAYAEMGCGIPGNVYAYMMEGFDKLDKSNPYDNGLTFNDVTKIDFETSRKGTAIQMRLINKTYDLPYRIVGFAAVESKDGKLKINKGWDMKPKQSSDLF